MRGGAYDPEAVRRLRAEREARDAGGLFGEEVPAPPAPSNGTTTSAAAAEGMRLKVSALRVLVLSAFVEAGEHGITREELAGMLPGGGDTLRPRVWELMTQPEIWARFGSEKPLLKEDGDERPTRSGGRAAIVRATPEGVAAMAHQNTGGTLAR